MRSCTHDAVAKSAPRSGKLTNKYELYTQFPPKQVKDTSMNDIENAYYFSSVINIFPVLEI